MRPLDEPHPWDMHFVKGPFHGRQMKVPPPARGDDVVMPYGDKMAIYKPVTLRGTPVYEFTGYTPKAY